MSEETDVIDADKRSMLKRKAVIWGSALVVVVWFFFWGGILRCQFFLVD